MLLGELADKQRLGACFPGPAQLQPYLNSSNNSNISICISSAHAETAWTCQSILCVLQARSEEGIDARLGRARV